MGNEIGCPVAKRLPADRIDKRLAQGDLAKRSQPSRLGRLIPHSKSVRIGSRGAFCTGRGGRWSSIGFRGRGNDDAGDMDGSAKCTESVEQGGNLKQVAREAAILLRSEAELQTEGVEIDPALDRHVCIEHRRDRPWVAGVIFAPRCDEVDDGRGTRSKLLGRVGSDPGQLHKLLEVEIQRVRSVNSGDNVPHLNVATIPVDHLPHMVGDEASNRLEIVFPDAKPVRSAVFLKAEQVRTPCGDAVFTQPVNPRIERFPSEVAFLGFGVSPVQRERHEVEAARDRVRKRFRAGTEIDLAAKDVSSESCGFAATVKEDGCVEVGDLVRTDHTMGERFETGKMCGCWIVRTECIHQHFSGAADFLVDRLDVRAIEQAPVFAFVMQPHQLTTGKLEGEGVGFAAVLHSDGFDEDFPDVRDIPYDAKPRRSSDPFAALEESVRNFDVGAEGDAVASEEVGALHVDLGLVFRDAESNHANRPMSLSCGSPQAMSGCPRFSGRTPCGPQRPLCRLSDHSSSIGLL